MEAQIYTTRDNLSALVFGAAFFHNDTLRMIRLGTVHSQGALLHNDSPPRLHARLSRKRIAILHNDFPRTRAT